MALDLEDLALDYATVEKILTSFLREESSIAGFHRGVFGLSGGLDSAVVGALAARALGAENVLGVMMPANTSSPESLADAKLVAETFGIPTRTVAIGEMADAYLRTVPAADRVRRGNVYARCRMIVLYDISVETNALVLGTSNKTELLLGYGTLHGDMASAINPIGDLYKTQIRALAKWLNVPLPIIEKPPSADLWPGQKDEDELGASYETLDQLLHRLVDQRIGLQRLVELGHDEATVRAIARRVRMNQFKRRPPVIAKLLTRTIGPDFRLPRDAGRSHDRDFESPKEHR